ncbi:MAG: hypothetical protein QOC96_296 [Acidobacteriota bacterium]|jgi:hypothetical protein|nr:hypothetical protein [Acidobacteriota bacterium]
MKRIILLAACLLAASACTSTPESNNANTSVANTNVSTNASANANTTASPNAEAGDVSSNVISQEKQIYDAIKSKNSDSFAGMLTDDFIYVAPDGMYDKAGTVNGVKNLDVTDVTLSDWKVLPLSKDAAVVYYNVTMKGTSNGKPMPGTPLRASSAWVNRGGKWVGIYHQECEIKPPPPPPPASTKPAAKASPGMSSMPAACGNDDAVAREKMVWDALKKKDANAFGNYLADDAIEIESDGVYDKAGSIQTVSQFDFSKFTLSDFKTINLASDVALVTYLVKGSAPGFSPQGERHTTIWVKHNGNWQAEFHHGTPIMAAPAKK